jgi:hypothetical protein
VKIYRFVAAVFALVPCLGAAAQTTKPTIGPLVWYQPPSSFQKWHDRGIKTLLGYENEGVIGTAQVDKYCASAKAAGFAYVLTAAASTHWQDVECVGVLMGDEPNAGGGKKTPVQFDAEAAGIRTKTSKPIYVSLNAGAIVSQSDAEVSGYCRPADVICFFSYPINYGAGMGGCTEIVSSIAKIRRLAPGKQIVLITECSDQKISLQDWTAGNDATGTPLRPKMRGPTGAEMAAETQIALAMGASGIGYFPDVIGQRWEGFDGTNPDCEAAMKAINLTLLSAPGQLGNGSQGGCCCCCKK